MPMTTWARSHLGSIGKAEELQIASLRDDGSYTKPVTIWVVSVDDDLFVRSVNGRTSAWFRGVLTRHEGRISAAGIETEVIFSDADPNLNEAIDAAYRAKYRRYEASIVDSIVSPKARSATIRLMPR
jgi:hypothetical protein